MKVEFLINAINQSIIIKLIRTLNVKTAGILGRFRASHPF